VRFTFLSTRHGTYREVNCLVWPALTIMASVVPNVGAQKTSPPPQKKEKPSPLRSIIAGSTAGAVEIAITYPAEFAKTRTQLNQRLPSAQKLPWPPFGPQWYAGCTTLIIGNSIKAGVRFVAFDQYKQMLSNPDGTISGPMTVVSGFLAGATESLLAVTPFESIKTQLIDDRKRERPRMRGFLHGSGVIWREQGIKGFFKGFVPTTARQAANSAVRFSSYTSLKQAAQSYVAPGEKLGTAATFAIGGMAGTITVYATQPIDTVKTRMQSLEAKAAYKNSLDCAMKIVREEGVLKLWSGALPRLGRLVFSGGIVFAMYEKTMELLDKADPGKKYI
jgi:solute carrier family 25 (mitochondrial citrate transporter), member 1